MYVSGNTLIGALTVLDAGHFGASDSTHLASNDVNALRAKRARRPVGGG